MDKILTLILIFVFLTFTSGFQEFHCNFTVIQSENWCWFSKINVIPELPGIFAVQGHPNEKVLRIRVTNSNITVFPKFFIQQFPNLLNLTMVSNNISEFRHLTFLHNNKLLGLNLKSNKIHQLEEETFYGLRKLKVLELCCNKMTKIDKNAFSGVESLEELNIHLNKIEVLHKDTFKTLENLKILNLRGNLLTFVFDDLFSHNPNLKSIDLGINKINGMPQKIFSHLNSLGEIYLEKNDCINKNYHAVHGLFQKKVIGNAHNQYRAIESDLQKCSENFDDDVKTDYMIHKNFEVMEDLKEIKKSLSEIHKKLENLTEIFQVDFFVKKFKDVMTKVLDGI